MNQNRIETIHKILYNHILHEPTKLLVDELVQYIYSVYKERYQEGYEAGRNKELTDLINYA